LQRHFFIKVTYASDPDRIRILEGKKDAQKRKLKTNFYQFAEQGMLSEELAASLGGLISIMKA
jgi:hypothetical protein